MDKILKNQDWGRQIISLCSKLKYCLRGCQLLLFWVFLKYTYLEKKFKYQIDTNFYWFFFNDFDM